MWGVPTSVYLSTSPVQIFPAVPLLHHCLQVLAPDHAVLNRILDHGADQTGRHVPAVQAAVSEMSGERDALVDHRDRLSRAQRAAGALDLRLAVRRDTVAQLP